MTSDFKKQYEHPLWQKKRLDVLEEADWRCQKCWCKEKQLNVHHKYYKKGKKVWDYDLDELSVLCEECHKIKHGADALLDNAFREVKRCDCDLWLLESYLHAMLIAETTDENDDYNFNYDEFYFEGVANYFGVPSNLVSHKKITSLKELRLISRALNNFW